MAARQAWTRRGTPRRCLDPDHQAQEDAKEDEAEPLVQGED